MCQRRGLRVGVPKSREKMRSGNECPVDDQSAGKRSDAEDSCQHVVSRALATQRKQRRVIFGVGAESAKGGGLVLSIEAADLKQVEPHGLTPSNRMLVFPPSHSPNLRWRVDNFVSRMGRSKGRVRRYAEQLVRVITSRANEEGKRELELSLEGTEMAPVWQYCFSAFGRKRSRDRPKVKELTVGLGVASLRGCPAVNKQFCHAQSYILFIILLFILSFIVRLAPGCKSGSGRSLLLQLLHLPMPPTTSLLNIITKNNILSLVAREPFPLGA